MCLCLCGPTWLCVTVPRTGLRPGFVQQDPILTKDIANTLFAKSYSEVSRGLEYLGDIVRPSTARGEALQLPHVQRGRLPHPEVL